MKTCKIEGCTNECMPNRRICHQHRLLQNKVYRASHPKRIISKEYICDGCGQPFISHSKTHRFCEQCVSRRNITLSTGCYKGVKVDGKKIDVHRKVAKDLDVLPNGRYDVVHHLDGDITNNLKSNLIVLSLADHGRLHSFIKDELLKDPNQSIVALTWKFINENGIPYFHCNDTPIYLEDELDSYN